MTVLDIEVLSVTPERSREEWLPVLDAGGRVTTVIDGWICVLRPDADPDPLVELVEVPMTLSGLSRFNVENALAAASASLAAGLDREDVVAGLREGDEAVKEAIRAAIARKPKGHDFDYSRGVGGQMTRHMSHTGG